MRTGTPKTVIKIYLMPWQNHFQLTQVVETPNTCGDRARKANAESKSLYLTGS